MMLGISAPQGCGKSTLVECLVSVFDQMGLKTACVSIDDFYLAHEDQKSVGNQYEDNPLLQCRGNAMTHDVPLGFETLKALKGKRFFTLSKFTSMQKAWKEKVLSRFPDTTNRHLMAKAIEWILPNGRASKALWI